MVFLIAIFLIERLENTKCYSIQDIAYTALMSIYGTALLIGLVVAIRQTKS